MHEERVWATYDEDGQIVVEPVPEFVPPRGLEAWYLEDGSPNPDADWVWELDDSGEVWGLLPNVPYLSRWFWEPDREQMPAKVRKEVLSVAIGFAQHRREVALGHVESGKELGLCFSAGAAGWPASLTDRSTADEGTISSAVAEISSSVVTIIEELNADGISDLLGNITIEAEGMGPAASVLRLQADTAWSEAMALALEEDPVDDLQRPALLRLRELARWLEVALAALRFHLAWLQELALDLAAFEAAGGEEHEHHGEPVAREHGPPPPLLSRGSCLLRHAPPGRFFSAPLVGVVRPMRVEEGCLAA